jgi:nucleotide-binding universal stress UspA family protein
MTHANDKRAIMDLEPLRDKRGQKVPMMTAAATRSDSQVASDQIVPDGGAGMEAGDAAIVAALDSSSASEAVVDAAVGLSAELAAPITFVHVRRSPSPLLGRPLYQRRLTAQMALSRLVLDAALDTARRAGVAADAEVLEGVPSRRIIEFARDRGARIVVVGSRRRRFRPSVSGSVARACAGSVLIARKGFRGMPGRAMSRSAGINGDPKTNENLALRRRQASGQRNLARRLWPTV